MKIYIAGRRGGGGAGRGSLSREPVGHGKGGGAENLSREPVGPGKGRGGGEGTLAGNPKVPGKAGVGWGWGNLSREPVGPGKGGVGEGITSSLQLELPRVQVA